MGLYQLRVAHLQFLATLAAANVLILCATGGESRLSTPPPDDGKLRIIVFGAHPDDAEFLAGGVAAMWAEMGHHVKFVSVTNGDLGHYIMGGGPLARRRTAEVERCAQILGIDETQVLDIHDGELMPSLENRKTMARLIREWQADIVMAHRPYDYNPDHRYVGVLAQDTAFMVTVPSFCPDTPPRRAESGLPIPFGPVSKTLSIRGRHHCVDRRRVPQEDYCSRCVGVPSIRNSLRPRCPNSQAATEPNSDRRRPAARLCGKDARCSLRRSRRPLPRSAYQVVRSQKRQSRDVCGSFRNLRVWSRAYRGRDSSAISLLPG